jgi:hypothetical protein
MIVHRSSGVGRAFPLFALAAAALGLAGPAHADASGYTEATANPAAHIFTPVHKPSKATWVPFDVYDVPTGTTSLFLHATCPSGDAISGGILPNSTAAAGEQFVGQGPRIDLNPPDYTTWFWRINWSGSGSASGSTLTTAVYCSK